MKSYHFILTRFNLRLWSTDKNKRSTHTKEWMQQRLSLFETYTLPSVASQTVQNFKWIVLFSSDTPLEYKPVLDSFKARCPQLRFVGVAPESSANFAQIFSEVMQSEVADEEAIVTSTYLDNDDALNVRYLEYIESITENNTRYFVFFPHGMQYFTQSKIASTAYYRRNHFHTLVEHVNHKNEINGVFAYGSHYYICKQADVPVVYACHRNAWLEVIHQTNVINDVRLSRYTRIITNKATLLEHFAVNIPVSTNKLKSLLYLLKSKLLLHF